MEDPIMKKLILPLFLVLILLCGCSEVAQQVETLAQNVDVEAIVTGVIEKIDWDQLQSYAKEGYDALVEKYPALAAENVKAFLKDNGLDLMNKFLSSTNEETQANADKLGQILKILYPDLTDEVDQVLVQN